METEIHDETRDTQFEKIKESERRFFRGTKG